ncbi:MAG: transcriptional regulator [Acidimicrobiia bacterium]|nr:transcriptional regulator [Acidimicrobiia bacterium]MDX2468027.1 transcriptional regulator [Acidimicrobiia bacterium]
MSDVLRPIDPNRLVHEPGRLAVLVVLNAVEEADFLFLMAQTGLTKGNLSSHTAKLEGAGYVEIEKGFVGKIPRTIYRLTEDGVGALREYREHMAEVLGSIG